MPSESRFYGDLAAGKGSGRLTALKPNAAFVTIKKVLWRQARHCRPPLSESQLLRDRDTMANTRRNC